MSPFMKSAWAFLGVIWIGTAAENNDPVRSTAALVVGGLLVAVAVGMPTRKSKP